MGINKSWKYSRSWQTTLPQTKYQKQKHVKSKS